MLDEFISLSKEKLEIIKELRSPEVTKGDRVLLQRRLERIEEKLEQIQKESTVSGDIAQTQSNLMATKDKKSGKSKKVLKRPEIFDEFDEIEDIEKLDENIDFSSILNFNSIDEFKKSDKS